MDMIIPEGTSRRCDREAQTWVLVLNDIKIVLLYCCARLVAKAKPEKGKEPVVERKRTRQILYGNLDVIDDRFHMSSLNTMRSLERQDA